MFCYLQYYQTKIIFAIRKHYAWSLLSYRLGVYVLKKGLTSCLNESKPDLLKEAEVLLPSSPGTQ